jgi:aromatic-L-amino-acid decarboxylase
VLSLFSFRHTPEDVSDLDAHNVALVNAINDDGRIYLTQSVHDGMTVIRFVSGQFDMKAEDADIAYEAITEVARKLV